MYNGMAKYHTQQQQHRVLKLHIFPVLFLFGFIGFQFEHWKIISFSYVININTFAAYRVSCYRWPNLYALDYNGWAVHFQCVDTADETTDRITPPKGPQKHTRRAHPNTGKPNYKNWNWPENRKPVNDFKLW